MRASTILFALISTAIAAPAASPAATGLSPAPTSGAPCECGQAPNFVYSRCFENADGSHSIWNCMPGSPSCSWNFVANEPC